MNDNITVTASNENGEDFRDGMVRLTIRLGDRSVSTWVTDDLCSDDAALRAFLTKFMRIFIEGVRRVQ